MAYAVSDDDTFSGSGTIEKDVVNSKNEEK
jgi:hypothetical protein